MWIIRQVHVVSKVEPLRNMKTGRREDGHDDAAEAADIVYAWPDEQSPQPNLRLCKELVVVNRMMVADIPKCRVV